MALETRVYADPGVAALLEKVASLQVQLGDAKGAAATRTLLPERALQRWVRLALAFSGDERVVDFECALRRRTESAEPKDLPLRTVFAGQDHVGTPLLEIRAVRENP
jgi:hypothetical protein